MRAERSAFPGVVILVKNGREILLPGIDFTRLTNVKYRTLVRQILEANQGSQITLPEMQLLWDAVVHKLFGFECACVKEAKANEVNTHDLKDLTDCTNHFHLAEYGH